MASSSTSLALTKPPRSSTWPLTKPSAPPSTPPGALLTYLHNVITQSGFVWVSDGRPAKPLPFKHATPDALPLPVRPIQKPKNVAWPVLLSAAQVWELLEGYVPGGGKTTNRDEEEKEKERDPADKWFVYSTWEYHASQPRSKKLAPHNVNGLAKTHICLASTHRTLFTLEIEVELLDVVSRSHPECHAHKFEYSEMIVGIIRNVQYETDAEIVGVGEGAEMMEEAVKAEIKGVLARWLEVYLLVRGTTPVRMEDRSAAERAREALRMKLDFEMAVGRVMGGRLRMLTGAGRAEVMGRLVQGGSAGGLFLER